MNLTNLRLGFIDEEISEGCIRRILIARELDVLAAYQQWLKWTVWRRENNLQYLKQKDVQKLIDTNLLEWFGNDLDKRACVIVRLRNFVVGENSPEDVIVSSKFVIIMN